LWRFRQLSLTAGTIFHKTRAGTPLMTLEAMKMETVVRAGKAGTVKEVVPALRATVQAGDLLAVLE